MKILTRDTLVELSTAVNNLHIKKDQIVQLFMNNGSYTLVYYTLDSVNCTGTNK